MDPFARKGHFRKVAASSGLSRGCGSQKNRWHHRALLQKKEKVSEIRHRMFKKPSLASSQRWLHSPSPRKEQGRMLTTAKNSVARVAMQEAANKDSWKIWLFPFLSFASFRWPGIPIYDTVIANRLSEKAFDHNISRSVERFSSRAASNHTPKDDPGCFLFALKIRKREALHSKSRSL